MHLAILAILLAIWPWRPPQATDRTYAQPAWRFSVRRDRFTGGVECRLFQGSAMSPAVAYARRSLAFRFARSPSTLEASYRIDRGPPLAWTKVYPALIAAGAGPPGGSMDNPTGGLVILPLTAIGGGHTVTIRPTPGSWPRTFHLDGLADTLATAKLQGCAPDAVFVR
ncbi:MAG TPA: hypothetical protein VFC47_03735 [Caulobacteraceae bacterium]|nr:hypothetical protein [Caulobacteraceae bacterium]